MEAYVVELEMPAARACLQQTNSKHILTSWHRFEQSNPYISGISHVSASNVTNRPKLVQHLNPARYCKEPVKVAVQTGYIIAKRSYTIIFLALYKGIKITHHHHCSPHE